MSDKYFTLFEAVTWVAFGRTYKRELYIDELPEHEKPTRRYLNETEVSDEIGLSAKEFYCRHNNISSEEYDARFIDEGLSHQDAYDKLIEAQKKLIAALADESLNVRAEGREDEYCVGPPEIIPHNHFRAQIGFDYDKDEIFPNPKELGAILHLPDKPRWYGVEISKEDIKRVFRRSPSAMQKGSRKQCEEWLEELMRDGRKTKTKMEYFEEAKARGYNISLRTFNNVWEIASEKYPTHEWNKSGKIKGKSYS